jgi:UDP-glucose:(heptosyl)LPS alpha-1,3-glucosyltransferase
MDVDCLVGFNKMAGLDVCWCGDPCLSARLREEKALPVRWLPRYRTYLRLEELVFSQAGDAELLILTESERERIVADYGTSQDRMHLLPGGIDPARFGRASADGGQSIRQELGIDSKSLMVLSVGSSFRTKGVDRSLRAISRLPEATRRMTEFVVVGNGDQRRFRRLAERLAIGDRVHFTGGRDDVADFYRAADILLHPARTETAGHILLEAMICGLPVVVTGNCGYAFHVERAEAGLLCPHPFGQSKLDQLLVRALCSSDRDLWRRKALDYCQRTDLYSMVDRAADVIVSRAERNRSAGRSAELRKAS